MGWGNPARAPGWRISAAKVPRIGIAAGMLTSVSHYMCTHACMLKSTQILPGQHEDA